MCPEGYAGIIRNEEVEVRLEVTEGSEGSNGGADGNSDEVQECYYLRCQNAGNCISDVESSAPDIVPECDPNNNTAGAQCPGSSGMLVCPDGGGALYECKTK